MASVRSILNTSGTARCCKRSFLNTPHEAEIGLDKTSESFSEYFKIEEKREHADLGTMMLVDASPHSPPPHPMDRVVSTKNG